MDLHDYLVILRKRWLSIVVVTVAGIACGVVGWLALPSTFSSQSSVFISVQNGETARDVLGGSDFAAGQVLSYAEVARSAFVKQPALDGLDGRWTDKQLGSTSIDVSVPTGTTIIRVSVTADDPQLAVALAQSVADQLVQAVEKLSPVDSGGKRTVAATVISPAGTASSSDPKAALLVTVGLLVGLGLGLVQALVRGALHPPLARDPLP